MKLRITFIFLMAMYTVDAQKTSVQEIIHEIEFGQDSIKSVYDWVANNIKYDVRKLKDIGDRSKKSNEPKFRTREEYDAYQLEKVIKTKKGVCEDYSLLFDKLVEALGYTSYIIQGYTKNPKGKLNRGIGHAWNAVHVDNEWKLFDATWGAGHVRDDGRFVKKYNAQWFDVKPAAMLINHMPFDPIWQLSDQPISYIAFEENKDEPSNFQNFNHEQAIDDFLAMDKAEKLKVKLERSANCGEGIGLINRWRKSAGKNLETQALKSEGGHYKMAEKEYKEAIVLVKKYIEANNNRFQGDGNDLATAKNNLLEAKQKVNNSIDMIQTVDVSQRKLKSSLRKNLEFSKDLLVQIDDMLERIEKM